MRRPRHLCIISKNTGNVTNVRVSNMGDFWDDFLELGRGRKYSIYYF